MPINIIIGLGNSGDKYAKTRHNAGFWLLDKLADNFCYDRKFNAEFTEIFIKNHKIYLLKPMTFMNLSGDAVQKALHYYKISPQNILVVHDELDFPVGVCKLKKGGGHGGHNGLRDITNKINSGDFLRLRVGIGHPGDNKLVSNYVLTPPKKNDKEKIDDALIKAIYAIEILIQDGIEPAMLKLHS